MPREESSDCVGRREGGRLSQLLELKGGNCCHREYMFFFVIITANVIYK